MKDMTLPGDVKIQVKDFRFFIPGLRRVNDKNEEVPVQLAQDSVWQFRDIALLGFENGQGECEEKGTAPTNSFGVPRREVVSKALFLSLASLLNGTM